MNKKTPPVEEITKWSPLLEIIYKQNNIKWPIKTRKGRKKVSYKTKHNLTTQFIKMFFGIYLFDLKMYVCTKKPYSYAFICAFFMSIKNWNQLRCPPVRWLDKQTVTYPYIEILFSDKNQWAINPQKDREES